MARGKIRIEGLRELDRALGQLPKATGRNVLRRVLTEAGEPMASAARVKAPKEFWNLSESIDVSSRLAKSQRTGGAKMTGSGWRSDRKNSVEMYVGPGQHPQAITQEFGTYFHGPQPFMRPAWDSHKMKALHIITHRLWVEIDKAAQRLARKAARG